MLNKLCFCAVLCLFCQLSFCLVKYDLNSVSEEDLLLLGLPKQVVYDILTYRENKKFETLEELKNIRSVESFYNMLEKYLYVVRPQDYKIRPGDKLFVFGKETDVLPDGKCVVYNITLDVAGLTIDQLKEKCYRLLGQELDIVVRKISGWVYVVGEKGVVKPGNYQASTLLELISLCEVDNAKFSGKILIYRSGVIKRYNFIDLMLSREDPKIEPADRVYFKKRVFWKVIETFEPIGRLLRDFAIIFGISFFTLIR